MRDAAFQPWSDEVQELSSLLGQLVFTDESGEVLDVDDGFATWIDATRQARDQRNTVFFIGNGASASMASHFSADLAKNGKMRTQTFSDLSLITAISNDISYEQVFAEPLQRMAGKGDLVIAISSSGNSPNILAAATVANELGCKVVTLTGMKPGNAARKLGWLNAFLPAPTYGLAETSHAAILHHWMDMMTVD